MTKFDPLALDYHILSLQQITSKCMAHDVLGDELYCQVLREVCGLDHKYSTHAMNQVCGN